MLKNSVHLVIVLITVWIISCITLKTKASATENSNEIKWPEKVEIVVAAEPAGDTDFNARILAEKLAQKLDTTFVISNVPEENGLRASRLVAEAANDGSKVLFYNSAFAVNQLSGISPYGLEDYEFTGIAAESPGNVLTITSDLGINSLEELFEYAKMHSGELRIAVHIGATSHAMASLLRSVGLDAKIIGAGGSNDRLAQLVSGTADITLVPYGLIKDYVEAGILVPLAIDSNEDLEEVEIKSFNNLGYDIGFPFYYFFAFPKGTDPALVQAFTNALREIVEEDPSYANTIYQAYYQQPVYFNPTEGLKRFEEVYQTLGKAEFPEIAD